MVETGSGTLPEEKIESVALRFNTNKIQPDSLSKSSEILQQPLLDILKMINIILI